MARLFAERLAGGAEEEIDTGFGVDLMRLSCLVAERIAPVAGRMGAARGIGRRAARSPISSTA